MLFDCGEGTQRQMMRYGVGFSFTEVFFTHFHADHMLGIIGPAPHDGAAGPDRAGDALRAARRRSGSSAPR